MSEGAGFVAQNCILLYRGIAFCERRNFRKSWKHRKPAECNSAIQQNPILRYAP
jgi:hypothetical protein